LGKITLYAKPTYENLEEIARTLLNTTKK